PFEVFSVSNVIPVSNGYAFIGDLPKCYDSGLSMVCRLVTTKINIIQLIGQFLIAIMIAVGVFFGFKSDN
ncbi:MAG: hypothetical protein ACI9YE_002867, partial [Psychroserpens sp.]